MLTDHESACSLSNVVAKQVYRTRAVHSSVLHWYRSAWLDYPLLRCAFIAALTSIQLWASVFRWCCFTVAAASAGGVLRASVPASYQYVYSVAVRYSSLLLLPSLFFLSPCHCLGWLAILTPDKCLLSDLTDGYVIGVQARHPKTEQLSTVPFPGLFETTPEESAPEESVPDNRTLVNSTIAYPYNTVGLIQVLDQTGEVQGLCSGALIGPNIVLTAAHCLLDPDTGTATQAATFTPGYNPKASPKAPYGTASMQN